ncbi:MAG: hypothetical protein V4714_11230 [Bacteroidota bacterium]
MNASNYSKTGIIAFFASVIFLFLLFSGNYFYSAVGVAFFLFFLLKFLDDLGNRIALMSLIVLLASLQWIVGPYLSYRYFPDDPIYYMIVEEAVYMDYVVPATICMSLGLYIPLSRQKVNISQLIEHIRLSILQYANLGLVLIGIGLGAKLLEGIMPASLRFIMFLLGGFQFIGVYFLLLSERKYKWMIFGLVLGILVISTIRSGLFHDLILWIGFLSMIISVFYRISYGRKIILFLAALVGIVIIQSVKGQYRQQIWYGENIVIGEDNESVFTDLVQEKIDNPSLLVSEENLENLVTRINQGWIIARVMDNVPTNEPYAEGKTVVEAVFFVLVPRFLNPAKEIGTSREYFMKFTGLQLTEETSMGISQVGEFYANYGARGGILSLFFLGLFFNVCLSKIYSISKAHPTIILWIPLIFLQVVKAETDIVTIVNHLFKASILVWITYLIAIKIFKIKI